MDAAFESLPIYMMVGIVVVIGVSQFNRVAGALLSVAFWTAVAAVGMYGYGEGHAVGLPGVRFPQWLFLGICLAFAGMHVAAAWAYVQRNRRRGVRRRVTTDEDD